MYHASGDAMRNMKNRLMVEAMVAHLRVTASVLLGFVLFLVLLLAAGANAVVYVPRPGPADPMAYRYNYPVSTAYQFPPYAYYNPFPFYSFYSYEFYEFPAPGTTVIGYPYFPYYADP
jgi:hypothetical protein